MKRSFTRDNALLTIILASAYILVLPYSAFAGCAPDFTMVCHKRCVSVPPCCGGGCSDTLPTYARVTLNSPSGAIMTALTF